MTWSVFWSDQRKTEVLASGISTREAAWERMLEEIEWANDHRLSAEGPGDEIRRDGAKGTAELVIGGRVSVSMWLRPD